MFRYILVGANSSECLHTAQWSEPSPVCERMPTHYSQMNQPVLTKTQYPASQSNQCFAPPPAVPCGLPSIPPYAKIVYDRQFEGDTVPFGFGGVYECLPPMILFGNKRVTCAADGTWTVPPECRCEYEILQATSCMIKTKYFS